MSKLTKRQRLIAQQVESLKVYKPSEGFSLLKSLPRPKFVEAVDVAVNLGIDSRKSDQVVRGAAVLPAGLGRTVRVAVFSQGSRAEEAKKAGADLVGFEDLAEQIKKGEINFDVLIASPDAMRLIGPLGPILGPRGLMPNPKVGTVTQEIEKAVLQAKSGQVRYRADKGGIIHCRIGNVDFSPEALHENLSALVIDLIKHKPPSSKGIYLKKITVSTTMGPGLILDTAAVSLKYGSV